VVPGREKLCTTSRTDGSSSACSVCMYVCMHVYDVVIGWYLLFPQQGARDTGTWM
jgi:hypothetical protein